MTQIAVRRSFDEYARRLRRRLRHYPALQPLINRVGLWVWRQDLRRRSRARTIDADAGEPIAIDPRSLRSQIPWLHLPFDAPSPREVVGSTRAGDWDRQPVPLSDHPVIAGIEERFRQGLAWEATSLYAAARRELDAGRPLWKFRSEADLPRLFEKIDELHTSISAGGYRSQRELGTNRLWDEALVAIDRDGRLHMVDGAHRIGVARVLDLEAIPALVAVRHAEWSEFRREVFQYAQDRGVGTYQRLEHPDLATVPFVHGGGRWELISPRLPAPPGRALDIGANSGLFSFRLARRGYSVTAVERSQKESYILGRLVRAAGEDIDVRRESIFDVQLAPSYRVVLALNIFHHFFKERENVRRLEELLARLWTSALFLETHARGERQMSGAYFDPAPHDYARWVAERAGLQSVERIGEPDGRALFLLSRIGPATSG